MATSDSEEDLSTPQTIKTLVFDCLSDVQSAGSFATYGSFAQFVLPGIVVDEVREIQLPLSSNGAQDLIRSGRLAPFDKGTQTLVDERVRKTWEIDKSRISFSNQAWDGWLDSVVRRAATDLGIVDPKNVRAELFKMLLNETGAICKPRMDTEKTPGIFGTLVICLPSEHVGGVVHLAHGRKEIIVATAEWSTYNATYIAWYADVNHEIKPVESGYRWILTYNLVYKSGGLPKSASQLDDEKACFRNVLAKWRDLGPEGPEFLCYAMDHQYTNEALHLALKGNDHCRASYLADSCAETKDFWVLLASLQRTVYQENDESGLEDAEDELKLRAIVDVEGFPFRKSLPIREDCLVQDWLYESRDPDKQCGGDYMGYMEYAAIETSYDDSVFVLVRGPVIAFLLGEGNFDDFEDLLLCLLSRYKMPQRDQQDRNLDRDLIIQTCQRHLITDSVKEDSILGLIALVAIIIADQDLFGKAVNSLTIGFPEIKFSALGYICFQHLSVLQNNNLIELFSRIQKFYIVRRRLLEVRNGIGNTTCRNEPHLQRWVRDRIVVALRAVTEAHPKDAAALIDIMNEYDDKMFEDCVKPFIGRFVKGSNFSNALVVEILSYSPTSSDRNDLVGHLFPLVLDAAASQFELQNFYLASQSLHTPSWPEYYGNEEKCRRDAENIVGLYQQLLKYDSKRASDLLVKIQVQMKTFSCPELGKLIIALLERITDVLDPRSPHTRQFYLSLLTTYMQKEPGKPKDWSRPSEVDKHQCDACRSIWEFLVDPVSESGTFTNCCHLRLPHCETKREGHTVFIQKTLKGWEEDHERWQMRTYQAQKTLKRFPQAKSLLADEYDAIMKLGIVTCQDDPIAQIDKVPFKSIIPRKRARSDSSSS